MNHKYLFLGTAGALSGSILYYACSDLYKIYVKKTQISFTPIKKFYQVLNPGLLLGLGLGVLSAYTGKPLIKCSHLTK